MGIKKKKKDTKGKDSGISEDTVDTKHVGSSVLRKQTELARVLQVKIAILQSGELSYLEYLELRDEIGRLNSLKEMLAVTFKAK